jgi:hypothetical protein
VLTHAHGFVARDDQRREIVVAFRGSHELADMVTGTWCCLFLALACSRVFIYVSPSDANLVLTPLVSRGVEKNETVLVHAGFLISYNSVRAVVVHVVRDQLLAFPDYAVVITGGPHLFWLFALRPG